MSPLSCLAVAAAVLLSGACQHESAPPMTPASGTAPSSAPSAPSDTSVTEPQTPSAPTPDTPPPAPDNDSRGTAMPGTRGTNDGSQLPPHAPNGTGAPTEGPHGAPVGGIH